jgi:hypothetical protein
MPAARATAIYGPAMERAFSEGGTVETLEWSTDYIATSEVVLAYELRITARNGTIVFIRVYDGP